VKYRVELTKSATRELRRIPEPFHAAIIMKLRALEKDPRPAGCKKLVGESGYWRIRVGNYRVIYSISDVIKLVRVEHIGDRKDVYK